MDRQELLSQLLSNISDDYDKAVGSFFYDAEYPMAIELETLYQRLTDILKQAYVRTATGEHLEDKVAEQGLTRKPATIATGAVIIAGDNGTIVPAGTKVASDGAIFSTIVAVEIIDETATVNIKADAAGASGTVPAGAINRFPVTISGAFSVTNTEGTTGGYDEESDESLRERHFEKVTKPATSGNVHHYKLWAKEVPGVGDAKVIPLWAGPGTVKIVIVDVDKQTPTSGLIQGVAEHIEAVRPIGADVTIMGATPVVVNISVNLDGDPAGVEQSIQRYLDKVAFTGKNVSYAQIGAAILLAPNVNDYDNLTVNGSVVNIILAEEELGVLGDVSIT